MALNGKAQLNFQLLLWPLIAYGFLASLYIVSLKGKIWFSWHPAAMLIGFVTFAGNATLIKKIGGYQRTKMHGNLMMAALASALFGFYVIYSNKEMFSRPHFLSLHGKLGLAVTVGYLGIGAAGALMLHPDYGMMNTNKFIRAVHKYAGRVMTGLAWYCCVLGFMQMEREMWKQLIFGAPLLGFGLYVLI